VGRLLEPPADPHRCRDEEVLLDDAMQFHHRAEREGRACDVHV